MILSVSRRTDIPNYYSDWFLNRVREGFLYVRNPMNAHQISRIDLSADVTDCIVFWTKNPAAMLGRLSELDAYPYYFQFTLTGYGRDIEPNLPDKRAVLIPVFRELSKRIGPDRVIWRYDPILFNRRYTEEYHLKAFEEIAEQLKDAARRVVISFVDFYAKTQRSMERLEVQRPDARAVTAFAGKLAEIARKKQMEIVTCAEQIDLRAAGIAHGSCIDRALIERLLGCSLEADKDKNQRAACGCVESIDVGTYHTCRNGCRYCYANFDGSRMAERARLYDPAAPLLCGQVGPEDRITERKVRALAKRQLGLEDYVPHL